MEGKTALERISKRGQKYRKLTEMFNPIAALLNEFGRTDLDGLLWKLAQDWDKH